jgi:hypothetical protein
MQIPTARSCHVFVWEHELEDYVNRRFASEMEQAEYHKKRHEEVKADYFGLLDELAEMEQQNRKLKRMNKVLQFSRCHCAGCCYNRGGICMDCQVRAPAVGQVGGRYGTLYGCLVLLCHVACVCIL